MCEANWEEQKEKYGSHKQFIFLASIISARRGHYKTTEHEVYDKAEGESTKGTRILFKRRSNVLHDNFNTTVTVTEIRSRRGHLYSGL